MSLGQLPSEILCQIFGYVQDTRQLLKIHQTIPHHEIKKCIELHLFKEVQLCSWECFHGHYYQSTIGDDNDLEIRLIDSKNSPSSILINVDTLSFEKLSRYKHNVKNITIPNHYRGDMPEFFKSKIAEFINTLPQLQSLVTYYQLPPIATPIISLVEHHNPSNLQNYNLSRLKYLQTKSGNQMSEPIKAPELQTLSTTICLKTLDGTTWKSSPKLRELGINSMKKLNCQQLNHENFQSLQKIKISQWDSDSMMMFEIVGTWNLDKLRIFSFDGNHKKISDSSLSKVISGSKNIDQLNLTRCSYHSMDELSTPLKHLKNLHSLDLTGNKISAFCMLENSNLHNLCLNDNKINDLKNFQYHQDLQVLQLSKNHILQLQHLDNLQQLKVLDLSFNKIYKIQNLETLTNLETLDLSHCYIKTIEGLSTLTNLKHLNLNHNHHIKSIENLETLTNLTHLSLSYTSIGKIDNLHSLTNLVKLELSNNRFTIVENLQNLLNLQTLDLSKNQGQLDVARFANLKKLRNIDLSGGCQLINLQSLRKLPNLWRLNLTDSSWHSQDLTWLKDRNIDLCGVTIADHNNNAGGGVGSMASRFFSALFDYILIY
ncbi:hypothetical protein DASC09_046190 [Saccharomycopsis crataegensis]|uniref:Disease resistance R13L4/SHOC-2-like LRR domain-containing protein n=1 Tax=Saccharomycopsis crataegensis TaxID=43959 RepID=A0AAV5QRD3_9ASCO|nr:hypothetical protein DASC09_046190 [Saccharomycopsis crataegensis]